jgi:hypothetical protein
VYGNFTPAKSEGKEKGSAPARNRPAWRKRRSIAHAAAPIQERTGSDCTRSR